MVTHMTNKKFVPWSLTDSVTIPIFHIFVDDFLVIHYIFLQDFQPVYYIFLHDFICDIYIFVEHFDWCIPEIFKILCFAC